MTAPARDEDRVALLETRCERLETTVEQLVIFAQAAWAGARLLAEDVTDGPPMTATKPPGRALSGEEKVLLEAARFGLSPEAEGLRQLLDGLEKTLDGRTYLRSVPKAVPPGKVLVHNHVRPTRRIGSRGFRIWLADAEGPRLTPCECGWAPELETHFRVVRPVEAGQ